MEDLELLKYFDWDDDDEFISTFFNVMQHIHDEENLDVARTRAVVNHDRQAAHDLLVCDYFADNYDYNDDSFERCFRLNKAIFLHISNALEACYDFLKQNPDVRGRMGFSRIQKCADALGYLGYGMTFDASDEYLKISERNAVDCVDWFCACVYEVFHQQYLRKPTPRDIERLYSAHEERHGFPGSNNDINVLGQSLLFNDLWTGKAPDMTFTVNEHLYKYSYYLCDGIYPNYSTLMKAYLVP
ncbi:uncharacterized protein LOC111878469 [Lactuca sativa]|uniref:uncharacterized protein LOC111878469 n=1 Tax=Lactuca sativa TaxID=4236 RepID=UPI000CD7E344|nr:uncharacterized protein LOC111878469 [Lactuca sativa]